MSTSMAARASRRRLAYLLVLYMLGLAVVLLDPSASLPSFLTRHADHVAVGLGIPAWLTVEWRFEFLANALIVVPAVTLAGLLWPTRRWTDWTAYAFVLATSVELAQALFLPDRTATFVDVVANTTGAVVGGLLVAAWGRWRPPGVADTG